MASEASRATSLNSSRGIGRKADGRQSADLEAVRSIGKTRSTSKYPDWYANPWNSGAAVNMLDVVILGATEVDVNFNANVNTEADGALLHGTGGHQDTAAGAKLTIIAQPLLRGRIPVSLTMSTVLQLG